MQISVRNIWPIVDTAAWVLILTIALWLRVRLGGDRPGPDHGTEVSDDGVDASPPPPAGAIGEPEKYAVRLALTFGNWVNRRIETFEFMDADTVRRKMSVDFTYPSDDWLEPGQMVYVPIMLLGKEPLRNLDVVDPTGRSLNVLTIEESRAVTLRGLTHLLGTRGRSAPGELLTNAVHTEQRQASKENTDALGTQDEVDQGLDAYPSAARGQIEALIDDLDSGALLLVSAEYQPNSRYLVKLSYDTRFKPRGALEIYRWVTRLASSVGLMGRQEEFSNLAVGWSKSYHAEVVPASDTYSADATLEVTRPEGKQSCIRDDHPTRPHLRAVGVGSGTSRGDTGRLTLLLHARRDGLVFPLFVSAAIITAVLAFVPRQAGHLDGITLGALLLAPFALAAYYANSTENSYVTNAMRGVRLVATVPIASGILVIALLALGYLEPPLAGHPDQAASFESALSAARIAAHTAAWSTVGLLIALVSPRFGAWTRPAVWALQDRIEKSQGSRRSRLVALLGTIGGILVLSALAFAVVLCLYAALPL